MLRALRTHWPEYLIEGGLVAFCLIAAGLILIAIESPAFGVPDAIPNSLLRRGLAALADGAVVIATIYSVFGQRSGAHTNPAVTLAFLSLGKVRSPDAIFYVLAQFAGAVAGLGLLARLVPRWLAHPSVNYAATLPGTPGPWVAFAAEFTIAFVLMLVVLHVSNTPHLSRWTGLFSSLLMVGFVIVEAPLSGSSTNPARSFGPEVIGSIWTGWWIYFAAPILATQAAAWVFRRSERKIYCAKLHHHNGERCIFNCEFGQLAALEAGPDSKAPQPSES